MWVLLEDTFTIRRNWETGRELEHQTLLNCQLTPCLLFWTAALKSHQDKSRSNSENTSFQKHFPEGSNIRKTLLEHSESQFSPLYSPLPVAQSRSLRKDVRTDAECNTLQSLPASETSWGSCNFHVFSLQKISSIQHELHPWVWLPGFKLCFDAVQAGTAPSSAPLCQLKDAQHAIRVTKTPLWSAVAQC